MKNTVTTLTGIPLSEVPALLDEQLEPAAYSAVPGAVDLTDIKPAWLTEALNRILGLAGYGWWYDYEQIAVVPLTQQTRNGPREIYQASLDRLVFYYRLLVEGQEEVVTLIANGGSENEKREYAVRGAITNALGAAAAKLGWQLSVYQNKRSHRDGPPEEQIIPFGKYKGQKYGEVPADYLRWLVDNAKTEDIRATAEAVLEGSKPSAPPTTPAPVTASAPSPAPAPASGNGKGNGNPEAVVVNFGKHSGQTLGEIFAAEPSYVEWLAENAKNAAIKAAASLIVSRPAAAPATATPIGLALEQARKVTLPFGTRTHPQLKGQTLAQAEQIEPGFLDFLASPKGAKYPALHQAAQVIVAARVSVAQAA